MTKHYLKPGDHVTATSTSFTLIRDPDGGIDFENCHMLDDNELKFFDEENGKWLLVHWDWSLNTAKLYYETK